jgi:hypothetical protein
MQLAEEHKQDVRIWERISDIMKRERHAVMGRYRTLLMKGSIATVPSWRHLEHDEKNFVSQIIKQWTYRVKYV